MSDTTLARYDAACKALAEARSVDEVKDIHDKAEAIRAYARQSKNKKLEMDAASIRIRAKRKLGELLKTTEKAVGTKRRKTHAILAVPLEDRQNSSNPPKTYKQFGISKNLAARCQKLASVPEEVFEQKLAELRRSVEQEGKRVTTDLLKIGEAEQKAERSGEWRLELRVPEKEYEAWKEAAKKDGLLLSEWARRKLNRDLTRIVEIPAKPVGSKADGNGERSHELESCRKESPHLYRMFTEKFKRDPVDKAEFEREKKWV